MVNLKQLVNNKPLWDSFLEEIDSRIATCHKQLEQANSVEDVYRFQGEIKALRKLKYLRDQVNGQDTEAF